MFAALISSQRSRYFETTALFVIILVGGWLRFQNLQYIELNIDQAYPIWQALYTLSGEGFPLVGQKTSVLFANPPLTGYLFLPFMAMGRTLLMPYIVTLTLNSFAIWLSYRGLRWLIGVPGALIGSILFATNPWIVDYSRTTWVQSLMPFFVSLIFWALAPVLTGKTRHPKRRTLIALIGLAIFAHTYLLAFALVAPVGILLGFFYKRIPPRQVLIGGGIFVILFSCYAFGLLTQKDSTVSELNNFRNESSHFSDVALNHAVRLVTGSNYALAKGTRAPLYDSERRHQIGRWIHLVLEIGILAGLGRAFYVLLRPRNSLERDAGLILLVWFLVPILMMSYVAFYVHPFYLLLSLPAGHGLVGWGIAPLFSRRGTGIILAVLLGVGVGVNSINTIRFAQETRALPKEHLVWVQSLRQASLLGERIRQKYEPGMAIVGPMDSWILSVMAGRNIRGIRANQFDQAMLIPEGGGIYFDYFFENGQSEGKPLLNNLESDLLVFADNSGYEIWQVKQEYFPEFSSNTLADIGVNLNGWTFEEGEPMALITFWQIEKLYPERGVWHFTSFIHVFDKDGNRILNVAGNYFSPWIWGVGDVLVQKFILPPDSVTLYLGFYDGVRNVNAIFRLVHEDGEVEFTPTIIVDLDTE